MKFIPIEKCRNLVFNDPVFVKDDKGVFHMAKLMEKKHTADGIRYLFEVALFSELWPANGDPVYSTTITHIAIPKN